MDESLRNLTTEYTQAAHRRKFRHKVVTTLAAIVVFWTTYALILPAITMEQEAFCELEEHVEHTDECYAEFPVLCCECTDEEHEHNDECYEMQSVLICEKPLHTHSAQCFSDPTADVESPDVWEAMAGSLSLSGKPEEDVPAIARAQLGYAESIRNYRVNEDGSLSGYTRYGDWAGEPYADWNELFCTFCLHYAGVEETGECEILTEAGYIPAPGDIAFLQNEDETRRAGIVAALICGEDGTEEKILLIEGDVDGAVVQSEYALTDESLLGYCPLPIRNENETEIMEEETAETEEALPEDTAFVLSAALENGMTVTVSGLESALPYPAEQLSLQAVIIEDEEASALISEAISAEEEGTESASVIEKTLLLDICILRTDPDTGEVTEIQPTEAIRLAVQGFAADSAAESIVVHHVDTESGTVENMNADVSETGDVEVDTDHFSEYGFTLLAASPSGTKISSATALGNINGSTGYLTTDISISSTISISKSTTLDLNGHTITTKANPLFKISSGTLTIIDSAATAPTLKETTALEVERYGEFAEAASYSSETLTYYVTDTTVTNPHIGATSETRYKYTVSKGMIVGNQNGRAFEVSGGTLNLNGGYICNFKADSGGAISQSGGTVNLNNAVLAANSAQNGGAVYTSGGTFNISGANSTYPLGGIISGNRTTGDGGCGIWANGSGTVNMTGGYVTNNRSEKTDGVYNSGGAIRLESGGTLKLSGTGKITDNYSTGGGGGVVCFQSGSKLLMSGGFVSGNNGVGAEGGGIRVDWGGHIQLTGGYVTNNIAGHNGYQDEDFQDWGGGGIFCAQDSASSIIQDALIAENKAGGFGGGVAGCSTGRILLAGTDNSVAIFDNYAMGEHTSGSASTKSEDHDYGIDNKIFMENGFQDYYCALSSDISGKMLGGGAALWRGSSDGYPVSSTGVDDSINGAGVTGLTCYASDGDKLLASQAAKVFITGNESPTHGGGVLNNGYLIMGSTDSISVYGRLELGTSKKLYNEQGQQISLEGYVFTFDLINSDGEVVAVGSSDSSGNIIFDRRIPFTKGGNYTYYLREHEPENSENGNILYDTSNYKIEVTVGTSSDTNSKVPWTDIKIIKYQFKSIKITETVSGKTVYENTSPPNSEAGAIGLDPTGSDGGFENRIIPGGGEEGGGGGEETSVPLTVKVTKSWSDAKSKNHDSDSVTVQLLADGEAVENGQAVLKRNNGWTKTWTDLDSGKSYSVAETPVNGYAASYSVVNKTTTTEVDTGQSNGAWLYKLNTNTKRYERVTGSVSALTNGASYIISNAAGDKLLYETSAHQNAGFDSSDVYSISTRVYSSSKYYYPAESIPDECVFEGYSTHNGSYNFITLKNKLMVSCILVQKTDNVYLKGGSNPEYSSALRVSNGLLQGQEEWGKDNAWRYVVWTGAAFDTATSVQNIKYQVISSIERDFTVTNTPTAATTFSLNVVKTEKGDANHVLPGAKFVLKNSGGTTLRFSRNSTTGKYSPVSSGGSTELVTGSDGFIRITGLSAGSYTLSEASPPAGYRTAPDQTVTLGLTTELVTVTVEDEEITYEMPETGGSAGALYLVGAALLLSDPVILLLKARRRKRE